jgi:hypothetical protein
MSGQSPLKSKPLRIPGQSLDEEIDFWLNDRFLDYVLVAACLMVIASMEWIAYLGHLPRYPVTYSIAAAGSAGIAAWRFFEVRRKVKQLRQGRDGERVVGQFLERLRDGGGQVFHDVPGEGFNLDHVVISTHGVYAIETKTLSKPWPKATITLEGETLRVAGRVPDRNPIEQVSAAARWLERLLKESTDKRFAVRGVVVFPGWFVEQRSPRGAVWVLEPKALPAFIEQELATVTPADVALAAFHLSRYVRAEAEKAA